MKRKSDYVITGVSLLVIGFLLIMGCFEMEPATLYFVRQILGSPTVQDAYYQGIGMGTFVMIIGFVLIIAGAASRPSRKVAPTPVVTAPVRPEAESVPFQVQQGPVQPRVEEAPPVTTKTKVLGYLLAYRDVALQDIASRFNMDVAQVEEIIIELLAEGKIKGQIDPETRRFKVHEST